MTASRVVRKPTLDSLAPFHGMHVRFVAEAGERIDGTLVDAWTQPSSKQDVAQVLAYGQPQRTLVLKGIDKVVVFA